MWTLSYPFTPQPFEVWLEELALPQFSGMSLAEVRVTNVSAEIHVLGVSQHVGHNRERLVERTGRDS